MIGRIKLHLNHIEWAAVEANYLSVLDAADAYVAEHRLDLPPDPQARHIGADPECILDPVLELDLAASGVRSIIWATGYALNFDWIKVDTFDEKGRPVHQRGVSAVPGLCFLGLSWLSRRASPFIWGVWHDAEYLAAHIASRQPQRGSSAEIDSGVMLPSAVSSGPHLR